MGKQCLFCNSSTPLSSAIEEKEDEGHQYRVAFDIFIKLLESDYSFEVLPTSESFLFCINCSELLLSLVPLYEVLEETKISIEKHVELIKKSVVETDEIWSFVDESSQKDVQLLRRKILKAPNFTRANRIKNCEGVSVAIQTDDEKEDVVLNVLEEYSIPPEEEIEIKLEDLNELDANFHFEDDASFPIYNELNTFEDDCADNIFEQHELSPENPNDSEAVSEEVNYLLQEGSNSQLKTKSKSQSPKEKTFKKFGKKSINKLTKSRRLTTKVDVLPYVPKEERKALEGDSFNTNIKTRQITRPSRIKQKSIRLKDYADPESITTLNESVSKCESKISRMEPTLTESDMVYLAQWGLDKLPHLQIVLRDIYKTEKNMQYQQKPFQKRRNKKTKEIHVDAPQAKSELDGNIKFKFKKSSLTSKRKSYIWKRGKKDKTEEEEEHTNVKSEEEDNTNDSDFDPMSEIPNLSCDSDSDYRSEINSEIDNQKELSTCKATKSKRKSEHCKTSRKRKIQKTDGGSLQSEVTGVWRRCRRKLSDTQTSIIIIDGKILFENREIKDEDNHLYCCFEACEFNIVKKEDLQTSCKEMLNHIKKVHIGDCKYQCRQCDSLFGNVKQYRQHFAQYHNTPVKPKSIKENANQNTECHICQKPLKYGLRAHLWTHLNDQERAEKIASGNRDPKEYIQLQKEKGKNNPDYQCDECGKRFLYFSYLEIHRLTHVKKEERKKFICDTCGQIFTTKRGFQIHDMKVHHPEKLLGKWKQCRICDKKFLVKTHYDTHMRRCHGAEKIHACDKCDKKFSCKHELKHHAMAHLPLDYRPYKCTYCLIAYRYPKNLTRHIKASHKDKLPDKPSETKKLASSVMTCKQMFPCEICERCYPMPSRLKKHMKTSHGLIEQKDTKDTRVDSAVEDRLNSITESIVQLDNLETYPEKQTLNNELNFLSL